MSQLLGWIFEETNLFPLQHVLSPMMLFLYVQRTDFVLLAAFLWEVFEIVGFALFNGYAVFQSPEEPILDSFFGDILNALIGVGIGYILLFILNTPRLVPFPVLTNERFVWNHDRLWYQSVFGPVYGRLWLKYIAQWLLLLIPNLLLEFTIPLEVAPNETVLVPMGFILYGLYQVLFPLLFYFWNSTDPLELSVVWRMSVTGYKNRIKAFYVGWSLVNMTMVLLSAIPWTIAYFRVWVAAVITVIIMLIVYATYIKGHPEIREDKKVKQIVSYCLKNDPPTKGQWKRYKRSPKIEIVG